jgi:hypothetical protein
MKSLSLKRLSGLMVGLAVFSLGMPSAGRSQGALDFAPPPSEQSRTIATVGAGMVRAAIAPPTDSAVNFTLPTSIQPPPAPKLPPLATPRRSGRPISAEIRMARQVELFAGGANSLVSRTVGHAEGTRGVNGGKTRAYRGHVDPGNGVWNLGSFSFQHCREAAYQCSTPEEADVYQLRRLQNQSQSLLTQAQQLGLQLTTLEQLNGIDLANQAPLAALGNPGYVALLRAAQARGLRGTDAVLWARLYSYWNSQTQQWDAPGLGNTTNRIRDDQYRRMAAIAAALNFYLQESPGL